MTKASASTPCSPLCRRAAFSNKQLAASSLYQQRLMPVFTLSQSALDHLDEVLVFASQPRLAFASGQGPSYDFPRVLAVY